MSKMIVIMLYYFFVGHIASEDEPAAMTHSNAST